MSRFVSLVVLSTLLLAIGTNAAFAQSAQVFAWQAPDCSTNSTYCQNFLQYELPYLSGIGYVVPWNNSTDTTSVSPSDGISYSYDWSSVEDFLNAYINYPASSTVKFNWKSGCVNGSTCQIMLIVQPESDSTGSNAWNHNTPAYVFLPLYATDIGADSPQDVIACHDFPGNGMANQGNPPLPYTGTMEGGDYVVWNANNCSVLAGDLTCVSSGTGITNFTAFPVVYEKPIQTAYQHFLSALSADFSTGGAGASIGQYISYVRAGMALGGENDPICAVQASSTGGLLALPPWQGNAKVPAGYVITPTVAQGNGGGYSFVSTKGGTTGPNAPTWNPNPGETTSDGGVTWRNEDTRASGGTAMWPGVNGEFGTNGQPGGYTDNGYLSGWSANNTLGYMATMINYLGTLNPEATFNWDISSHFGPGGDLTVIYPDSEAIMAYQLGNDHVGFGMQSLSLQDPYDYDNGLFPSSREDWIANFSYYPAPSDVPVHHLQTESPGGTYFGAAYSIGQIQGNGTTATITCASNGQDLDCSPYDLSWVYVTQPSGPFTDIIYPVTCGSMQNPCPEDYELTIPSSATGPVDGGYVWAPDYWPQTIDFSVNLGATRIEVYECDLDYAFGTTTTNDAQQPGDASGCANWAKPGPDVSYQAQLADAQPSTPDKKIHTKRK